MTASRPHPLASDPEGSGCRAMQAADLPAIGVLHPQVLPPDFFSRLGPAFLRQYYASFLDSPFAVALVYVADGRVAGFLVGAVDPGSQVAWTLRRHGPRMALTAVVALLRKPPLLLYFVRTRLLRYAAAVIRRLVPSSRPVAATQQPAATLEQLGVAQDGHRRGTGRCLVATFERTVQARGCTEVRLLTRADAVGAGGFYRKLGYLAAGTSIGRDGVPWTVYRHALA